MFTPVWRSVEGRSDGRGSRGSGDWPGIRVPYVNRTSTERLLADGNTEGAIGALNACLPKVRPGPGPAFGQPRRLLAYDYRYSAHHDARNTSIVPIASSLSLNPPHACLSSRITGLIPFPTIVAMPNDGLLLLTNLSLNRTGILLSKGR